MKKTIPFKKDISFNTKIFEINSISLEHNLKVIDNSITGEFIISGDYKESDFVINNEPFIYNIPCDISLDEKYNLDNIKIDIDDFNYEINDYNLIVNIIISIDGIEENIPDEKIEIIDEDNILEKAYEQVVEERSADDKEIEEEPKTSLFDNIDMVDECYVTYHVHIFREDDSIDKIIKLYNVNKEEIEEYNDLSKITIGSKIIIPSHESI